MIHFAGHPVRVGPFARQRCAWCGAILEDWDLSLTMVPEGQDGPSPWTPGALVEVEGNGRSVIAHENGSKLPIGTCFDVEHSPPRHLSLVRDP